MKIFLVSLDNVTGKERRSRLNYSYEIDYGNTSLDFVDPNIIKKMSRNNSNDNLFRIKCCHFDQMIKLLKRIVNEKLDNVIICEDDAIDLELIDISYSSGIIKEPVLLNAKLHHPKSWKLDTKKNFNENIKPIINKFVNGINEIDYEKYRWSCCACIYYGSWKSVENILNYYEKDKKQLTYFDLWLSKNKLIKYLYYPSLFKIDDNGSSQVNDHNHGVIKNYEVFPHNKKNKI